MQTTKFADPLAGIPGGEEELQRSAEILDGRRVLEVAQLHAGELVALRVLEEPRRRLCLLLAAGGIGVLVLGIALQVGWCLGGLWLLALLGGIGALVLGWSLRPRATVRFGLGEQALVRWRRGRFELWPPAGAEGELCSGRGTLSVVGRAQGGVPIPHDGRAWLRIGSSEVRLAWVRPARRLPRAQASRRPRWGIAAALGLSLLVHQAALALVLSVPPSAVSISSDTLEWITVRTRRVPPVDERTPVHGPPRRAAIRSATSILSILGGGGALGGDLIGVQEPVEQACVGKAPVAEVHLGHITASGPRRAPELRRVIERHLPALRGCYQAALAACSEAGRTVLTLFVLERGETFASVEAARFVPEAARDRFERCVKSEAEAWQFASATRDSTRVRVPLIFRFAGADPYPRE